MAGTEGRDPWNDFMVIRRELEFYQRELLRRVSVIIANKMDLPDAKAKLRKFRQRLYETPDVSNIPVYAVSAKTGLDIDELKDALRDIVTEAYEKNNPEYSNRKSFYAVDLTPQFNAALRQTSLESDTTNNTSSGKTELKLRKQSIPKETSKSKKHKSKKKSQ
jgi:GTPase involved in cell partitioning and DNA repair